MWQAPLAVRQCRLRFDVSVLASKFVGTARLQSADGRRQPFVFVAADLNPELNNTAARMPANFHDQRRKEYL